MVLSTPLCRVGTKKPIRQVIKNKAPSNFTTYIEPFVGGGSIYFFLDLDPDKIKSIINDKDTSIAQAFRILKANPATSDLNRFKSKTVAEVQSFVNKSQTSQIDKLAKIIYDLCGTFGGKGQGTKIYKNPNIEVKLKKIPQYAAYMKNTTVLNGNWKSAIKDSPNTFIYLDPPYEKSKGLYKEAVVDFQDMAKYLKPLKSKWLLSVNDSAETREIFKGFKIRGISVEGGGQETSDIGAKTRKELLVSNY